METRQKEELYQSQQEIMPLRDLSTVEMACIEYTLSVQQHPAFHGDKCHMSLLTLDKGSVYQRCQPAGPAGLSLTFITALSKRSPRIFLYFATPSSETLPLFPAHSPCSPQCFLALSLKKTMSSRNKTVSDLSSQGETVWGWTHPSKALKKDGRHVKITGMLK